MKPLRLLIISFWILLIFGALYLPNLKWIQKKEKSINIFCWGDGIDPDVVADFERQSRIKVHLNYYSSNEELLVKLKATKGKGYDLVMPSDYTVSKLIKAELLKPFSHAKLTFFSELNPLLLNLPFDPKNRYSIPFEWEVMGLGYNQDFFNGRPFSPTWKMLFEPDGYNVAMVNEPGDAVYLATLFLFKDPTPLSPPQLNQVREVLMNQKRHVTAYANFRTDYFLATKNCPLVAISSPYIWRTKKNFPFVKFMIPKEGTFISIENFCIPIKSEKEELIYTFLNYLYSKESLERHFETYGFFPALLGAIEKLEKDPDAQPLLFSTKEEFKKFHFFDDLVPQRESRALWIQVKTK